MNSCYNDKFFSTKSGAARAAPAAPLLTALLLDENVLIDEVWYRCMLKFAYALISRFCYYSDSSWPKNFHQLNASEYLPLHITFCRNIYDESDQLELM